MPLMVERAALSAVVPMEAAPVVAEVPVVAGRAETRVTPEAAEAPTVVPVVVVEGVCRGSSSWG